MNCPGIEEIMAWIDDELPPDRMESVRVHLDQCAACRRLSEYQKLIETTWRESYTPPSDFEFNRFEKQLTSRLFRRRSWIRTALPVAAAFAAVLLGIRIFVIGTPPPTVLEMLEDVPAAAPEAEAVRADASEIINDEILGDGVVLSTSEAIGECADSGVLDEVAVEIPLTGGRVDEDAVDMLIRSSISAQGEGVAIEGGESGTIDFSSATHAAESEAMAGQTVAEPADDQRSYDDSYAPGMILLQAEASEYRTETAANRYMQLDDLAGAAEEHETEEVIEEYMPLGTAGGGSGGFISEEHAAGDLPESCSGEEPVEVDSGWEAVYYGYDRESSGDAVTGEVESVSSYGAGLAVGGTASGEETCPDGVNVETVSDVSIVIALREDRRSRDNMDSTLQVLEQDIMLDWNEKSGPEEVLLPACVSISFQIAPDGSVFDIEVMVPPDSFFFDFMAEIESRISSLTFEEVPEDACMTVELDMVLF